MNLSNQAVVNDPMGTMHPRLDRRSSARRDSGNRAETTR